MVEIVVSFFCGVGSYALGTYFYGLYLFKKNSNYFPVPHESNEDVGYNKGIYDVDSFKVRMDRLKEEFIVEDYDGIPLYNIPVIKQQDIELEAGVEVITDEYEINLEKTRRR
jgi:hypothetical protein